MSTLRINNIEAKSVPASPTLDEKVKITNSTGDILIHVDGKTSGITTIGINTTASNITFDANSNIVVTGIITATHFYGDGSNLTGITAGLSNIVEDTSPQLGGNLDTNSHEISLDTSHAVNFGDSNELQIKYHGGIGFIDFNGSNNLQTKIPPNKYFQLQNRTTGENLIEAQAGGALSLWHAGSKKFETTSTGATITGKLSLSDDDPTLTFIDTNSTNFRITANTGFLYFADATNNQTRATMSGGGTWTFQGSLNPGANNTYDLGTSSARWRNLYTNDLHLSNKGHTNDIDNTWGDWTIQEGESDLFLKNNRSGKKYKFNLTEVS